MRLFNGQPIDAALGGTRALHYGDGVFRTGLIVHGSWLDRERQLHKLASDANRLDLVVPDSLERDLDLACRGVALGTLKVILSRRDSGRGYRPGGEECDVLLESGAPPDYPRAWWEQGIDLGWSKVLLGIQRRLAGIKHLNRLEQVLASRECPADRQDVILCDAEGRVTCGSRSNLFFLIDGILVTPDVSLAGVAGMMRDKIIEAARGANLAAEIGLVSPDEVRHSSEMFVTNSVVGIWPVRRVGSLELPAPGPIARSLNDMLHHPWSGR